MNNRPHTSDYPQFYHKYVEKIEGNNGVEVLENYAIRTLDFLKTIPEERWDYRYAPEKWTLKESWVHVIDSERVFAYRALRIGRGDQTPLPGFEQNDYVPHSNANARTPLSIIEEYEYVARTTLLLFRNFPKEAWERVGVASGGKITVNALAFIIIGHATHHLWLTKDRYLS